MCIGSVERGMRLIRHGIARTIRDRTELGLMSDASTKPLLWTAAHFREDRQRTWQSIDRTMYVRSLETVS